MGGYLSNASANFLKKYDNDPEELLGRYMSDLGSSYQFDYSRIIE